MQITNKQKYAIIEINGGIGKSIMATAVCEAIKKQYPDRKIIAISAWPEPLIHNQNIWRTYKSGAMAYFYEDIIADNDVLFLCQEPYRSRGYLTESKSLIESWCECIGVKYNGERPHIFLNPLEEDQIGKTFIRPKPIMLIQPFGGMGKRFPYAWNRDMPYEQAQSLVDIFCQQYHIMQVGTQDQPKLNNVEFVTSSVRDLFVLIKRSNARILIDSFMQHASAAFNLQSVVCWITNKPCVFGYDTNINIEANWDNVNPNIQNIEGGLQKYDFGGGRLHDFPFKDKNIFNLKQIIDAVQKTSR